MQPSREISRSIEIKAALPRPDTGCNRDIAQTFETIVPFTIEEAYEVADTVALGNMPDFKEELGDLLLQIVFQARIAEERGVFDFGGVVEAITPKNDPPLSASCLPRRVIVLPDQVKSLWARIKPGRKIREKIGIEGKSRAGRRKCRRFGQQPSRRRSARPARLDPCSKIADEGLWRRFRWSDWRWCSKKFARKPTRSRRRSIPANRTPSQKKLAIAIRGR